MSYRDTYTIDVTAGDTGLDPIVPEFKAGTETLYISGVRQIRGFDYSIYDSVITFSSPRVINGVAELTIFDEEDVQDKLDAILTAVVGSWTWDKESGIMTMIDQNGNEKYKYAVSDSAGSASRERRQDLEL